MLTYSPALPAAFMRSARLAPSTYSMRMNHSPSTSPSSSMRMMWG